MSDNIMSRSVNTYHMDSGVPYSLTLSPTQDDISHVLVAEYNVTQQVDSNVSVEPAVEFTAEQSAQLADLQFWLNAVLTNITVCLGLVGNMLTVIILSKRAMRSSTNIYLCALALWDCVVLVSTLLLIGLPSIPQFLIYLHYVLPYVISYFYPLALIAQTATIWLTVSFTVERYIAVCHPLKAARMCTIYRAKMVIISVSCGSALYNIPRWFEYRPIYKPDHQYPQLTSTAFGENDRYNKIYFSWFYVPIMCIIPLLTLVIMNLFLILAVRRSHRQRRDMNVRQSRENNVTIMLCSVVIVFIICQVPALSYNLAFAVHRHATEQSFDYQVLSHIRNFLVCFNSAINFLLYCALGQKFRRIFLHTFCRRCVAESYMPMSGVHQAATMVTTASHRRFVSRAPDCRAKKLTAVTNHSSSTLPTTCPSSQESSLISPGHLSPLHGNHACEIHTYTTMRDKRKPRTLQHNHVDSDDEPYDICLLREGDKDVFPLYKTDISKQL